MLSTYWKPSLLKVVQCKHLGNRAFRVSSRLNIQGKHVATVCFCFAISNPCQYCYPLPHRIKNNNNNLKNPVPYHLRLLFTLFTRGMISLMSNSSQTTQMSQFHFLRHAQLADCCSGPAGCCCNPPHATGGEVSSPCTNLNFHF